MGTVRQRLLSTVVTFAALAEVRSVAQSVIDCWQDGEVNGPQLEDLGFKATRSLYPTCHDHVRSRLRGRPTAGVDRMHWRCCTHQRPPARRPVPPAPPSPADTGRGSPSRVSGPGRQPIKVAECRASLRVKPACSTQDAARPGAVLTVPLRSATKSETESAPSAAAATGAPGVVAADKTVLHGPQPSAGLPSAA